MPAFDDHAAHHSVLLPGGAKHGLVLSEQRESKDYLATLTLPIAVDAFPDASVHRIVIV